MAGTPKQNGNGGCSGCLAWVAGLFAVGLVIEGVVWLVHATGYVLGLTPTYSQQQHHDATWVAEHYAHVGWGYALALLVLIAGIPLSVALTFELIRGQVRPRRVAVMAALVIALAATISLAPLGRVSL